MIVFTYKLADLLNDALLNASLRDKTLIAKTPELIDEITLSEDDAEVLQKYLAKGSALIAGDLAGYNKLLYDTDGVTLLDAYKLVKDDLTATPPVEGTITYRINVPETFNNSNTVLIDEEIKDAIENYIIYRINKHKGHDFESFYDDYRLAAGQVLFLLNQRTKTVKRRMNMF